MRYVESLRTALHRVMSSDSNVYLIGEDILDPYGGAFKVTKRVIVCVSKEGSDHSNF